jgi:hypothetical protein
MSMAANIFPLPGTIGPRRCCGTCVNAFDADGDCIIPDLPWSHVSDMALACEGAISITEGEFPAEIPVEISCETRGHSVEYLVSPDGVYMLYDAEADIHYFFI